MANSLTPQLQSEKGQVSFITRFIATGFFSGYSPLIPGTAGSLAGLCLYAIPALQGTIPLACAIIAALFIGTAASAKMEAVYGEDPPIVVIDEILGMWISLFLLPVSTATAVAAFLFFRLFDIVKPPPARSAEKLKHGWGIMLDDVVAGIYANLAVRLLLFFFPKLG